MLNYVIGLDVGGTKIAAGAVDNQGRIFKKIITPTDANRGKKIILKNILWAASKVWLPGLRAIGIGMAGQCNFQTGVFVSGPNFPKNFKNIAISKILEKNFRVPVYLDNDARAFTLAELIFGAGRGYKNIVGLTIGTGIGGGIVVDGKILRGKNNTAGEVGHMMIDTSSPFRCGCGKIGHFEAASSGTALENLYKRLVSKKLPGPEIVAKARNGDKKASQAIAILAQNLALGLANIAHLLDPEVIVIGGGLSNIPSLWLPTLRNFKKLVIFKSLKNTKIVKSKLGDKAGIIGAALLAQKIKV